MKYKHIILTALVFTFGFINLTNAGWEISVGEEDEGVIVNFKTFRPNVDNLYKALDENAVLHAYQNEGNSSEVISFNGINSDKSLNAVKAFLEGIPEGYFAPSSALTFNFEGKRADTLGVVVEELRAKAAAPEDGDDFSVGYGSGSDSDTNDN